MRRLVILIMFFTAAVIYSQDKELVSILDFTGTEISESELGALTDYFSGYIVETKKFDVIEIEERDRILSELQFSMTGCVDQSCQLEIGRLLQANQIIVGSVGKIADYYMLNVKMLEVETGKTLKSQSKKYNDLRAMIDDSRKYVFELVNDRDSMYTASEREVQNDYYNSLLDGYDPDRFYTWLEEKGYTDYYIAGDGYIKSSYIKEYKQKELGMRFTLSPEIGYTPMFWYEPVYQDLDGDSFFESEGEYLGLEYTGIKNDIRVGVIASFQPYYKWGLGVLSSFDLGDEFNWCIGAYSAYGNKNDGLAIGLSAELSTACMFEGGVLLFYKGLHAKISAGVWDRLYYLGISAGYSFF